MIALASVIIVISFLLQAVFGFGGGILAIPLLSLIYDVRTAVSLAILFQFLMGLLLINIWREIDWNNIKKIFPWLCLGLGLGIAFLHSAPIKSLEYCLSFYLLAYVISRNIDGLNSFKAILSPKSKVAIAGISSGVVQGLFGSGGPVLITWLQNVCPKLVTFRATTIATLFLLNFLRICITSSLGLFDSLVVQISLITLPFFLVCLVIGQKLSNFVSEKILERVVNILLVISAVILLFK